MIAPERALKGRDSVMPVAPRHAVLGTSMKGPFPDGCEQIVVGMGCFWGAERVFWEAPGVYTTAVGYAGGYTPNPTYAETCSGSTGHTEAVLVVFDPAKTSYEAMLKLFWENHNPDPGHAPGQRPGHPVPLGDLLGHRGAPAAGAGLPGCLQRGADRPRAIRRSPPRSPRPARSTTPRTTTSSTCTRTRGATAGSAAPASAARSASAPPRLEAARRGIRAANSPVDRRQPIRQRQPAGS